MQDVARSPSYLRRSQTWLTLSSLRHWLGTLFTSLLVRSALFHQHSLIMMETPVPRWLDKGFLEFSLQHEEHKSKIQVLKYTVKPAVASGNNFTSNVYRVHVQYEVVGRHSPSSELRSITLIVKEPIEEGFASEVDFFSTEPLMYTELLPKMNAKLKKDLAPKAFHCSLKKFLVLKDLHEEGYFVSDKNKQLDYDHCEIVFKTLAKFHATSVACHKTDPGLVQEVGKESMYHDQFELWKILQETAFELFIGYVMNIDGLKNFSDIVSKKSKTIWKSVVEICKPKSGGLNVLNHGDCWINNLMFSYDESNRVVDAKFIDFQFSRYTSPVLDLSFFLLTSPDKDVRCNRQLDLLKVYISTLNETFEELSCQERFTLEDLKKDLTRAMDHFLITAAFVIPFTKTTPEEAFDLASIGPDEFKAGKHVEMYRKMSSGKTYQALLPIIYQQFKVLFPSCK